MNFSTAQIKKTSAPEERLRDGCVLTSELLSQGRIWTRRQGDHRRLWFSRSAAGPARRHTPSPRWSALHFKSIPLCGIWTHRWSSVFCALVNIILHNHYNAKTPRGSEVSLLSEIWKYLGGIWTFYIFTILGRSKIVVIKYDAFPICRNMPRSAAF